MSSTIILTEDQYAVLVAAAEARHQTPEGVLAEWVETMRGGGRALNTLGNAPASRLRHHLRHHVGYHERYAADDPNATQPSMYR
jgi:hypothetical protein